MRNGWILGLVMAFAAAGGHGARGQVPAQPSAEADPDGSPSAQQSPIPGPGDSTAAFGTGPSPFQPGFTTGLFGAGRPNFLGNIYGLRTKLDGYGISLGLQETSEVLGNLSGGIRGGVAYNGLTTMSLGLDTSKALGWSGGILNISAFQIHGRDYGVENVPALQTTSGIQAQRATRLWELWFQQSFLGGKVDVKLGQQSLDTEFLGSQGSGLFIATAMGWPLVPTINLYAGGPAYPLASLGVRVRVQPFESATLLVGVYDDNPAGTPFFSPNQVRGAAQSGTKFNTGTGALIFAEAQYAPKLSLPGTYKLGGWYDSGTFYDQRFDGMRVSLDDPASGTPRGRRGNFGVYGVVDQMVWRPNADKERAISVFARLIGAPSDRNLAQFSVNAGVTMKAPFEGRDNDTAGIGFGIAKVSPAAIRVDQGLNALDPSYRVRGAETFIEATYQYQVAPWWTLQPDVQYVFSPLGGAQNPLRPEKRIGNAATVALRTNITF